MNQKEYTIKKATELAELTAIHQPTIDLLRAENTDESRAKIAEIRNEIELKLKEDE